VFLRQEVPTSRQQRIRDIERVRCPGFQRRKLIVEPSVDLGISPQTMSDPLVNDVHYSLAQPRAPAVPKYAAHFKISKVSVECRYELTHALTLYGYRP
jgi:hypothetical protein